MVLGKTTGEGVYGGYPASDATVFPFRFQEGSFVEAAGETAASFAERSSEIFYAYNLMGRFIPSGSEIAVFRYCNRWWCSHGGGPCALFTDDFNRADSADVGMGWQEKAGVWSIAANKLDEAGNAGAVIINCRRFEKDQIVYATLKSVVAGAGYRLIANWYDDDNYYFGEATFAADGGLRVRLGSRVAGVESILEEVNWTGFAAGGDWQAKLCCENGHLHLRIGAVASSGDAWTLVNQFPEGRWAGLGNGSIDDESAPAIDFDDFQVDRPECGLCPDCFVQCDLHEMSKVLHLAIVGADRCSGYSDEVDLTWSYTTRRWEIVNPTLCGVPYSLTLYLRANEEDGCQSAISNWKLGVLGGGGWVLEAETDSTCEPLSLHFIRTWTAVGPEICCANGTEYGPFGRHDYYVTE
jgi:hypothetical protein